MSNIILLNEDTINKIAAGEVIDRPSSVVKELVENSIDGGSSSITVEIEDGGKSLISVIDNGCGIAYMDLPNVFVRHATSKISTIDDLLSVSTLGFRGEAMASIASVGEVELLTRHEEETTGTHITVKNREIVDKKSIGYPGGTHIKVKNIFSNTPARLKFLKSDKTECNYITDVMEKTALCNTGISFRYIVNEKTIFHTPGNGDLLSAIQCIYGLKAAKMMLPLDYSNELLHIKGYIGKPEFNKGNSTYIVFSTNNRVIKNYALKEAVRSAYKSLLMNRRFPFAVLNIDISQDKIDVNVHPTKAEIKFSDERSVFNIIYYAVNRVLTSENNMIYENAFSDDGSVKEGDLIKAEQESAFALFDIPKTKSDIYKRAKTDKIGNDFNEDISDNKSPKEHIKDRTEEKFVIGQVFNTFILCQSGNEFLMIDQHAAHERIIYESLLEKKRKNQIEQQILLIPMIIELSTKEMNDIKISLEMLSSLGFDIEIFGDNSIAIRQVPLIMGHPCSGSVISELLDTIHDLGDNMKAMEEKALLQIACKTAIKAGDRLTKDEMVKLIDELYKTELYFTCPHGRPTILSMTRGELDKKFKRVL